MFRGCGVRYSKKTCVFAFHSLVNALNRELREVLEGKMVAL